MKRKIWWMILPLILSFTSCTGYGQLYKDLPQPDQMLLHYQDGTEMELLPGQEGFDAFFDCVASIWPKGDIGYFRAQENLSDIMERLKKEDCLFLQYEKETSLCRDPECQKVIGIVFPPNGEEQLVYYLQTTTEYLEVYFRPNREEPVYPPLSKLMDDWKKAASS